MKNYIKKSAATQGNEKQQQSTKKQDANLRKNGLLHFQIGLILSLLIVYLGLETVVPYLESKTAINEPVVYNIDEESAPEFTIYEEVFKTEKFVKEEKIVPPIEAIDHIEIIKDEVLNKQETITTSIDNITSDQDLKIGDIVYDESSDAPINILAVQFAPVFKGCENVKTNEDRRACLSDGINKIVLRNFNTSLSSDYEIYGKQRIDVQFTIDKAGLISDIKVRGSHPVLEKEAERVIKLIPKMEPGKQNNKNVSVIFSKPIIFKAH